MLSFRTPVILINFKAYEEATGDKAVIMANKIKKIAERSDVCLSIACQPSDIRGIARLGIPTLAQHVDPILPGNHTGHILAKAVKAAGAIGSLINHSEHQQTLVAIEKSLAILKNLSLLSVVCTNNVKTSVAVATLSPDFIAIEPPELIGKGIPVSKAEPTIITRGINAVKKINSNVKILCGAGISRKEDILAALGLGVDGVLIASAVVLSQNPKKIIEDLVSSFVLL